jgi:hypothetical protein
MELIQSKSLLAKLMATENLIVEQRNVKTASFDVENRILTVPVLDDNISPFLYDLFMGHEVGHALYTPGDGMKKAHELKMSMSIMNVLEDVRIEKKIKYKYPGIRQSFLKGYRELIEKDFFGTIGTDLNLMNFIDRVNLYTKGGATQGIKFTSTEKSLIQEIESTETYDDVIVVCQKVMDYIKEEKKNKQQESGKPEEYEDEQENESGMDDWSDGSDSDDQDWDDDGHDQDKDDNHSESREEKTDGKGDQSIEEDSKSGENANSSNAGGTLPSEESDIKSFTDDAFQKNQERLHSNNSYRYGNIPDVNLDWAIVDYKTLWSRYKTDYNTAIFEYGERCAQQYSDQFTNEITNEINKLSKDNFLKVRKDSNRAVSYLVKEFELRKNADQMKRASVAKTGDLNLTKIHNYKFSEDIFKKITVIPGGKSHGLVMFIDWSGSMSEYIGDTIKQLYNLVSFCKKSSIPFEVYAFTDGYYDDTTKHVDYFDPVMNTHNVIPKKGDIRLNNFKLMNLYSSKMSISEMSYASEQLVRFGSKDNTFGIPRWFLLGGTPLNEAIISAMKIVPKFQKENKLQIVNIVILTDGEGERTDHVLGEDTCTSYGRAKLVVRDPITKQQEIFWDWDSRKITAGYIKLLKSRTGSNVLGFYVLNPFTLKSKIYSLFGPSVDHSVIKSKFKTDKFLTLKSEGYDEYYLLNSQGMRIDENAEFEVEENASKRKLLSAFNKYTSNRNSSRVVLNKFIGMIT